MKHQIPDAPPPYIPYRWQDRIQFVQALKAMHKGDASPDQQKIVLDCMMELTGYYDLSYRPDSERDTAFAEGKRFVGAQLVKMVNLKQDVIEIAVAAKRNK